MVSLLRKTVGHFAAKSGGHLHSEIGGHVTRNLQIMGVYMFFPELKEFIPQLQSDLTGVILFIASYVVGHVVSPISALLDEVADYFIDKKRALSNDKLFDEREEAKTKARELFKVQDNKAVRRRLIEAMVRKQNQDVTLEIDALLATGKFFRSLFAVLVMFVAFPRLASCSNCIIEKLKLPLYYSVVVLLIIASFSIFVYYRSSFQDAVYRHFLCLFYTAKDSPN